VIAESGPGGEGTRVSRATGEEGRRKPMAQGEG
jgi:hypothetical protein